MWVLIWRQAMISSYYHDLETQLEYSRKQVKQLEQRVKMLRDALDQMDINICAAGDLMTKEDMQEAERLIALRDAVLLATKD